MDYIEDDFTDALIDAICGENSTDMTLLIDGKVYGGVHLHPNSCKYHKETAEMKQYLRLMQIILAL